MNCLLGLWTSLELGRLRMVKELRPAKRQLGVVEGQRLILCAHINCCKGVEKQDCIIISGRNHLELDSDIHIQGVDSFLFSGIYVRQPLLFLKGQSSSKTAAFFTGSFFCVPELSKNFFIVLVFFVFSCNLRDSSFVSQLKLANNIQEVIARFW